MNNNSNNNITPGCSGPFKGCLIITVLICGLFIGGLVWMMKLPGVNTTLKCRSNMEVIGDAITRYKDVNNRYPDNLIDLKKEYLKDASVLHCPLDEKNSDSYAYHRPGPGADGKIVVLECDRHRPRKDMPKIKLKLLKNGTIISQTPSYKQMLKEIEEKEKAKESKRGK